MNTFQSYNYINNIEDQANVPMEEDNGANRNVKEYEEYHTNIFIQDTFNNVGVCDDGNQFDVAYHIL